VTEHRASCRCGALSVVATGTPTRISVCHCLDCQKRSGSAFSAQVRFHENDVAIAGASHSWRTTGDSGRWGEFHFCPTCGAAVFYRIEYFPDMVAIPLGAFDDPHAFTPEFSVWESRKHPWLAITGIEHHD
jgi:hypothetical protein